MKSIILDCQEKLSKRATEFMHVLHGRGFEQVTAGEAAVVGLGA